jgi:hypothetical protein
MCKSDNNQVPYYNIQKNLNENFESLKEHGLHWITFIILTFVNENNKYFRCPYKIWNKFIS